MGQMKDLLEKQMEPAAVRVEPKKKQAGNKAKGTSVHQARKKPITGQQRASRTARNTKQVATAPEPVKQGSNRSWWQKFWE